ncbi:MAG: hypothetical protein OXQ96_03290 [Alphaproteobacteria bacterium]|nr:hypothetical protein [Alphaproteobacteria bacterium]
MMPNLSKHAPIMPEKTCPVETELYNRLHERLADVKRTFEHTLEITPETPEPDEKTYNLIVAPLADLHQQNLLTWGKALKGDGLLLASTWGAHSCAELTNAGITVNSQPTIQSIGDTLTRLKFALPVLDRDLLTLTFSSGKKLSEKLMHWGFLSEPFSEDQVELYCTQNPHPSGHIPVTIEVLYISAWRPHHSQQQPLEPGNYTVKIGSFPE